MRRARALIAPISVRRSEKNGNVPAARTRRSIHPTRPGEFPRRRPSSRRENRRSGFLRRRIALAGYVQSRAGESSIPRSPSTVPKGPRRRRDRQFQGPSCESRRRPARFAHFFAPGEPACGPCLAKPLGAEAPAAADFALSFFGFLASLLLRNCPLAITRLPRSPDWRFAVSIIDRKAFIALRRRGRHRPTRRPSRPARRSRRPPGVGCRRLIVLAPLSRHFIV